MKGSLKIALTISPLDRTSKYVNHSDLYRRDKELLWATLRQSSKHFILYPEIDYKGRLHYHGIVVVNDKIKWYKSSLVKCKKLGFTCIKILDNDKEHLRWLTYCMKEWASTQQILSNRYWSAIPIMPSALVRHARDKADPTVVEIERENLLSYLVPSK